MKRKSLLYLWHSCDTILLNEPSNYRKYKGEAYSFGSNSSVATTGSASPAFDSIHRTNICDK